MRRLLLLRHAKAAPPGSAPDRDRPLAQRGREAAPLMGRYLAQNGLRPDLALVSPSRRTRETWDLVRAALGDVPARFDDGLYESKADRLLSLLQTVEASIGTLLLIGHNPGLAELGLVLAGEGEDGSRIARNFPTAALAILELDGQAWTELGPGTCRFDRLVTPKSLGAGEDD
jgi:phosphohistidine phosphatase